MAYSYRENEVRYYNAMQALQKTMGFDDDANVADSVLDLVQRIKRIRELHKPYEWDNNIECVICSETEYPCETIKALTGEWDPLDHPVPRPEEGENNE
jgi:hypothetical protein